MVDWNFGGRDEDEGEEDREEMKIDFWRDEGEGKGGLKGKEMRGRGRRGPEKG